MTTHRRFANMMQLTCKCPKNYEHGICEGAMTQVSAYYTPEYAIMHEMDHVRLHEELHGRIDLPRHFGGGSFCYRKEVHNHGIKFTCGACHEDPVQHGARVGKPKTTKSGKVRGITQKGFL